MKNTGLMERPAATMKLVGGRLCLDFVNTVGGRLIPPGKEVDRLESTIRSDKLGEYADLLAWGVHAKLLSEKEADCGSDCAVVNRCVGGLVCRQGDH